MKPRVSIVTTTYNRAHTLVRAIESVQRQTWSAWEHIIVDDGSVDETESVVRPYLERDARVKFRWQPNVGPAAAMNAGASLATSPWITFLDCDDEYLPSHLQLRFEYLASHPEIEMLWGGVRVVGPRARQFVLDAAGSGRRIHLSHCRLAGTLVLRKGLFRKLGGFRKLISADYDLWRRAEARGARIVRVTFPTLLCHVSEDDRVSTAYPNIDGEGNLLPGPGQHAQAV